MSAPSTPARRVVLADDEPFARERLRMLLAAHPSYEIAAECEDGAQAVEAIVAAAPDVVFLDVRMPELDGLAVAEALEARLDAGMRAPAIVFVTAHEEYALGAFDRRALDYLLKPVDAARLARALARVEERAAMRDAPAAELRAFLETLRGGPGHHRRFVVRDPHGGLYFVRADEIEWVDARGNYVGLHAGGRVHLVRDTMKAFEAKLDPERFLRVHRSAIVNLDHVARMEPYARGEWTITLTGGTRLRTSRAHSARLHEIIARG